MQDITVLSSTTSSCMPTEQFECITTLLELFLPSVLVKVITQYDKCTHCTKRSISTHNSCALHTCSIALCDIKATRDSTDIEMCPKHQRCKCMRHTNNNTRLCTYHAIELSGNPDKGRLACDACSATYAVFVDSETKRQAYCSLKCAERTKCVEVIHMDKSCWRCSNSASYVGDAGICTFFACSQHKMRNVKLTTQQSKVVQPKRVNAMSFSIDL